MARSAAAGVPAWAGIDSAHPAGRGHPLCIDSMLASAFAPVLLAVVPCIAPCLPEPMLAAPAEPRTAVLLAGGGSAAASPGEAAELARQQTGGGQVLSVRRTGAGYEVRVLTPRGEVRIVQVPASGG